MIHFQDDLHTPLVTGNLFPGSWPYQHPQRLLVCPLRAWQLTFPTVRDPVKRQWGRSLSAFYHLVSKIAHCHFSSILFARSEPLTTIHSKREKIRLHHLKGELWKNLWAYFKTTKSTIYQVNLTSHHLPIHLFPFILPLFLLILSFPPSLSLRRKRGRKRERKNLNKVFIRKMLEN